MTVCIISWIHALSQPLPTPTSFSSLDHNPNPPTIPPLNRHKPVPHNRDIPLPLRLPHLQPPAHRTGSKHRAQTQVDLGVREIHAQTLSGPLAEWYEVFFQLGGPVLAVGVAGIIEPPLRLEQMRLREDLRVIVHEKRGHADGGPSRDSPVLVVQGDVGADSHQAVRDAIGDAVAFVDGRMEVGEVFEFGYAEGIIVGGKGIGEFFAEAG